MANEKKYKEKSTKKNNTKTSTNKKDTSKTSRVKKTTKDISKKEEPKKTVKKVEEKNSKIELSNGEKFDTVEVVFLIIVSVIVSLVIGCLVTYNLNKDKKVSAKDKDLQKIIKNYNYIMDNYYGEIDKSKLVNNAISGMLYSLEDDYTYMLGDNDSDNFDIQLEGEYEGIGIEIINNEDNTVSVYNVFEESPAFEAGLKVGDKIKKIDDKDFSTSNTADVVDYIRKGKKSEFVIKIERDGEEKEVTIKRQKVTIKAVSSKIIEKDSKKIGYIDIDIFSNVAYEQFKEQLYNLEDKGIDALVIDVRDNNGGHLTTATKIISLFLNRDHVIYQTDTKGKFKKYYSTGKITKNYPIAVIQNSSSASASEMLSAALKEEYGAIIVGERSYGKGTVQELLELDNNTEYKITTKLWLSPKGNSINKKGVVPDLEIYPSNEYKENPSEETDNQLRRSVEEVSKKVKK